MKREFIYERINKIINVLEGYNSVELPKRLLYDLKEDLYKDMINNYDEYECMEDFQERMTAIEKQITVLKNDQKWLQEHNFSKNISKMRDIL